MRKEIRKIMSVILAAAIVLCSMGIMASAKSTYTFVYDVIGDEEEGEDCTVWITGYNGTLPATLKIPAEIKGMPVESIEPMAFANCTTIKEVIFSDNIHWIEDYAFAGCKNLIRITIPGSLWWIGNGAFHKCDNLSTVTYTGYNFDYQELSIGSYNETLWETDWAWPRYEKGYDYSYREYNLNSNTTTTLTPAYDLGKNETVVWYVEDIGDDCLYVDTDGTCVTYGKGIGYVAYEVLNANGDVVFVGSDAITVKYSFLGWIIHYLLFGWLWGF